MMTVGEVADGALLRPRACLGLIGREGLRRRRQMRGQRPQHTPRPGLLHLLASRLQPMLLEIRTWRPMVTSPNA